MLGISSPGTPHHVTPASTARRSSGLTILEVLVILAIVVIVIVFAIPVRDRREPAKAVRCLNNLKQLNLGWVMYGSDWNDALIGNWPYANTPGIPTVNWVAGIMDWSANPDNTNRDLLVDPSAGLMASYVKSAGVYHCPWDGSVSDAGPRVRSYSMNGFLGNSSTNGPVFTGWKQCSKVGDLRRPAQTIVLADEHENSIDDGFFFNDPARVKEWMDLPAARHNGAASLGFADGHAEIHRWSEASTKQPAIRGGPKPSVRIVGRETGADLAWVIWRG